MWFPSASGASVYWIIYYEAIIKIQKRDRFYLYSISNMKHVHLHDIRIRWWSLKDQCLFKRGISVANRELHSGPFISGIIAEKRHRHIKSNAIINWKGNNYNPLTIKKDVSNRPINNILLNKKRCHHRHYEIIIKVGYKMLTSQQ